MQKEYWAGIIFALLILADTAYTFRQHQMVPLDGDMPSLILPAPHYEAVLTEPFGWAAATGEATYASPNRFFVHWAMYHYFRAAPAAVSAMADPVTGVVWSAAFAKTSAHLLLLLLLAWLAGRGSGPTQVLLGAVLILPLFQSAGPYNPVMGLIEPSPAYTFFYAWPSVLMLSWLALAAKAYTGTCPRPFWETLALLALTLVLPFTGPLIPGVIVVGASVGLGQIVVKKGRGWWTVDQPKLPLSHWAMAALLSLLGLYSLFLGTLSTEQQESVGLLARYEKLPFGLWKILTNKPGLPLLILGITLQFLLLRRWPSARSRAWARTEVRYLLGFILLYILLLPLGGYRDYRPDIVRRDTLQPVLLILFYLWGKASLLLIRTTGRRIAPLLPTMVLLVGFTVADWTKVGQPSCQERTLRTMSRSAQDTIRLSPDCRILTWPAIPDQDTRLSSELLVLWGILGEGQHFEYRGN